MRLKFEDWSDESDYTWEIVHDDTHFEPHAEPFRYRTFEEWARHYEPIRTTHWEVHFTMPRNRELKWIIHKPKDGTTVNK